MRRVRPRNLVYCMMKLYRFKSITINGFPYEISPFGLCIWRNLSQITISCEKTGIRIKWNDAVKAGWHCDREGTPFNAYYCKEVVNDTKDGLKEMVSV